MRRSLGPVVCSLMLALVGCSTGLRDGAALSSGVSPQKPVPATGGSDAPAGNPGTLAPAQPPPEPSGEVDATSADEAVPSGTNLSFETGRFDLDGEGGQSAALVVPAGWTRGKTAISTQ